MNIKPQYDYLVCKKLINDSGVVTENDIEDTHQKYEVLKVGAGRHYNGVFITPGVAVGSIIYAQKHAEADTPKELLNRDIALIQATRVMAIIGDENNG